MAVLMLAAQEEMARRRAMRRERVFRDRVHPLEVYNDLELYKRYRLDRQTIFELVDAIGEELDPTTLRNNALPRELKVLAALRFYASGSFQQVTGYTIHVSQPTRCRVISQVTHTCFLFCIELSNSQMLKKFPPLCKTSIKLQIFQVLWVLRDSCVDFRAITTRMAICQQEKLLLVN